MVIVHLRTDHVGVEFDVILPNIDYDPDHYLVDPDEQFCAHYGIDYDQVNCIELA